MSAEIKHVIGLLCKQLNAILGTNLKPELFRLAKFNKNEENVIPVLWHTLSLLTTKETEVNVEKIKAQMQLLRYNSDQFYTVPTGSRELLLAISFVIANDLPKLIAEEIKRSPFDDSYNLLGVNVDVRTPEIPNPMDEEDEKNYLKWLKGKTQQNKRMTEEYKAQIAKIYEKLNSLLNTKSTDKLSLNEILALTTRKYSKEFLEKTTPVLNLLELYQEWTRKEKIFWKWMATVLAERDKEC